MDKFDDIFESEDKELEIYAFKHLDQNVVQVTCCANDWDNASSSLKFHEVVQLRDALTEWIDRNSATGS